MTCKDCMHYDICLDNGDDAAKQNAPNAEEECDFFKNKADFVEVPCRCRTCKHRRETLHRSYCLPVFGLKQITDLDGFCSYGQRK